MEFNKKLKRPFSLSEKQKLKDIGLTLSFLNSRYSDAKRRARSRDSKIMPLYQFYRVLANLTIKKSKELNLSPLETLKACDIHSTNLKDYTSFELLTKEEHTGLHSKIMREVAQKILDANEFECKKCHKLKSLDSFYPSNRCLIGIEGSCKECRKAQNKMRKDFNDERISS